MGSGVWFIWADSISPAFYDHDTNQSKGLQSGTEALGGTEVTVMYMSSCNVKRCKFWLRAAWLVCR